MPVAARAGTSARRQLRTPASGRKADLYSHAAHRGRVMEKMGARSFAELTQDLSHNLQPQADAERRR
jgi:hypothetical protein